MYAYVWRSEDNLWESVGPSHYVGPGSWAQFISSHQPLACFKLWSWVLMAKAAGDDDASCSCLPTVWSWGLIPVDSFIGDVIEVLAC